MHKIYNLKQYFAHASFWTFPLYDIWSEKDPFIALGLTGWKLEVVKHVKEHGDRTMIERDSRCLGKDKRRCGNDKDSDTHVFKNNNVYFFFVSKFDDKQNI